MAVHGRLRIGVMIVVPSFAVREISHEEIVSAAIVGLIAAITPQMRNRINESRYMDHPLTPTVESSIDSDD